MKRIFVGLIMVGCLTLLLAACGDDDDDGGSEATASPTGSEQPSATETTTSGETTFSSSELPIPVTVTASEGFVVPEDADISDLFVVYQPDFPNGYVDFLQPTQVYNYASTTESELADPPADYVQWFNELPYPAIVDSQDVTVGGVHGTRLEIMNADNEDFALFKLSDGSNYDLDYLGQNGATFAYVLDVSGTQVLVICGTENASNFGEFKASCEDVMSTAEFGT